jgi:acyl dehydratase
MATNAETALPLFQAKTGQPEGTGDWFLVDQARIDAFAEVTEDRQFIHVDPVKSAELSPYKVTIAHGFLTLSMLSHLVTSLPHDPGTSKGVVMGVNYGFEKVRFVAPVPVDSRIRASSVLSAVEQKDPNTLQVTRTITIEVEGGSKPAVVADWVTRIIYG